METLIPCGSAVPLAQFSRRYPAEGWLFRVCSFKGCADDQRVIAVVVATAVSFQPHRDESVGVPLRGWAGAPGCWVPVFDIDSLRSTVLKPCVPS